MTNASPIFGLKSLYKHCDLSSITYLDSRAATGIIKYPTIRRVASFHTSRNENISRRGLTP